MGPLVRAYLYILCIILLLILWYFYEQQQKKNKAKTKTKIVLEKFDIQELSQAIKTTDVIVYSANLLNDLGWVPAVPRIIRAKVNYRSISDLASWNVVNEAMNNNNTSSLLTGSELVGVADSVMIVADPPMYTDFSETYEKIATSSPGYFVAFASPDTASVMDCSFQFGDLDMTIGYLSQYDLRFINAILNSYRIPMETITLQLLGPKDIPDIQKLLKSDIDIVFTYIIPNGPLNDMLSNQRLAFMGFNDLDVDRVRLFYPTLKMANVNIRKLFLGGRDGTNNDNAGVLAVVSDTENKTQLPVMSLSLMELANKATANLEELTNDQFTPRAQTERFATRLYLSPESLDPTFNCYGDKNIPSKALCDSPYDMVGQPKAKRTTWDQPCVKDEDCPFYQANTNYNNNRGGCMERGVCELPLGLRRVAYRKYDKEGRYAPLCYDCDPYDTECCDKQSSPDYAFANDQEARTKNGLSTSIPVSTTSVPTYTQSKNYGIPAQETAVLKPA